jgi:uncharacterized protein YecT (DUF1311 family)
VRKEPGVRRWPLGLEMSAVGALLLAALPLAAQSELEGDPCSHVYGATDLGTCWAREAVRAEDEMDQVYLAARQRLPRRAAESLEKAQELWLEFLEAHLGSLYGVESPVARWGRDFPLCLSISRATLIRERTRELRKLLEPDEDTICPL